MKPLSRRDVLKLSALTLGGAALAHARPRVAPDASNRPNILILLFDTTSAPHCSLYGYPRQTTPNLERFAARSTVYHAHYSAGNFTTPGTASILTGMLPWHHRAVNTNAPIRRDLVPGNLFALAGPSYTRVGFTQNYLADVFLRQFNADLDIHLPSSAFAFPNPMLLGESERDLIPFYAFEDFLTGGVLVDRPPGSLDMGLMDIVTGRGRTLSKELSRLNPREVPYSGFYYYENRSVYRGVLETIRKTAENGGSFLGYFHLLSPHAPYAPTAEFSGLYADGMQVSRKGFHALIPNKDRIEYEIQDLYAQRYDQFLANVDAEFGYLIEQLEQSRLLDNTYVVVLSDHGELFERGIHGHATRLLYQGVVRVPLLISAPGQTQRVDIHEPTSNVDILPTLAALMGSELPENLDGRILPGFGGEAGERPIVCVEAKEGSAFRPLERASFTLIRGTHKLIHYIGYPEKEKVIELYDLEADPDEIQNIALDEALLARRMLEELTEARVQADAPYAARK